jgi:hypothetical protein
MRPSLTKLTRSAVLAVSLAGSAGLVHAASKPKAPLEHLLPPEKVAASTRSELRARMERHGNNMSSLVKAVVLLDRPTIANLAGRISDEELIAKADAPAIEKFKPLLPKTFFAELDALRAAASDLAQAAAHGQNDGVIADKFSALTGTCVRCHSSYLHDLPAGAPSK